MRAFGDLDALAHLLNAVLNDTMQHKVTSINNVELTSTMLRSCIFNVYCTLGDGSKIIIELQKANRREELTDRLVGYLSRAYGEQWKPGGGGSEAVPASGSYKLVPVKIVAILTFMLEPKADASGSLVQNYTMCAREGTPAQTTLRRLQTLVDVTIVQLPLAPTSVSDEGVLSAAELWSHLLRYSQEYSMATLPRALQAVPYTAAAASARMEMLTTSERGALEVEENQMRDMLRLDRYLMAADAEKARADKAMARAAEEKARAAEEKARADKAMARAAEEKARAAEAMARAAEEKARADGFELKLQSLLAVAEDTDDDSRAPRV